MSTDPTTQPVPAYVEERVDAADTTLQNPKRAVIALGSNLGNRLETMQSAIDALEDTPGLRVKAVSPVYETEPFGVPDRQPKYFNAVAVIRTTLPPMSLLERAGAIEEALRRVRTGLRGAARTIDVDIIAYQGVECEAPNLTLPHPRAHERAFVLAPWNDVEPAAELPGRGRVKDLLSKVDCGGVVLRSDVELRLPE